MADLNRRNYFDKFLEKAVARSVITAGTKDRLSESWHGEEKKAAISGLCLALFLVSGLGVVIGLTGAVPEVVNSSLLKWALAKAAAASNFIYHNFTYVFTLSLVKAGVFFLGGLVADFLGARLAKRESSRLHSLVWPIYIPGAVLHAVATGYLVIQGIVDYHWEELEVTSIGFWCVIPLVMTVLSGDRPRFYQLLTGVIIVVHALAFYNGVSGNIFIAFDISTAVILISISQLIAEKRPYQALCLRYVSMTIICFLLYCTGFVWDLPAILEFRGYIKSGAHQPSYLFLILLLALTVAAMAAAYFLRRGARSRAERQFTLLLLFTVLFAYFSTGIIMEYVSVGQIYDVFGGEFKQSIFSSNAAAALLLSWLIWFLWCLWILIESKETGKIILAQIGVTAMLGSIEIRYVEICRNFSFAAGLVMLPIALILAAVSVKFLGKWLKDLLGDDLSKLNS